MSAIRGLILLALPALSAASQVAPASAAAMSPNLPRHSVVDFEEGKAAPFVGTWSMSFPDEDGQPEVTVVGCDRAIRIEAANETHIFYLGPNEVEADAAIQLTAQPGQTRWEPIAGGPRYFTAWTSPDSFVLYEQDTATEVDGAPPFVFTRCQN